MKTATPEVKLDKSIDNETKLRGIHVMIKQIASNTENTDCQNIAKVVAANLQGVIESMFGKNPEHK